MHIYAYLYMHIYRPPSIYMHIYICKYAKYRHMVDIYAYLHMHIICIYMHMPYLSILIYTYHMHIYAYWRICLNMLISHILAYNVLIFEVNSQRWPQTIGIPLYLLKPKFSNKTGTTAI